MRGSPNINVVGVPKFKPLKIPCCESTFHAQKRGKTTENKVTITLMSVYDKIKQIRAFRN